MQSSLRFEPAISGVEAGRSIRDRRTWTTSAAASGLTALALLLIWRRAAGAIHDPLPASALLLTAFLLATIAAVVHWVGKLSFNENSPGIIANVALSIALLAVAAAICVPGTSAAGLVFLWTILIAEEAWAWRACCVSTRRCSTDNQVENSPASKGDPPLAATATPQASKIRSAPFLSADVLEAAESALPEGVTQRITRSMVADGTEVLAGWLRVPFAVGQRTQNVHLAFCPPFAHAPELSVEQADGPSARIKSAQVLPYGARLELKLHAAEETPSAVVLQFSAVIEGRDKTAAEQRRTTNDQRTLP